MRKIFDILTNKVDPIEHNKVIMFESLMQSTRLAGGSPALIKQLVLEGMTVLELIDSLGPNNVIFMHIEKDVNESN